MIKRRIKCSFIEKIVLLKLNKLLKIKIFPTFKNKLLKLNKMNIIALAELENALSQR